MYKPFRHDRQGILVLQVVLSSHAGVATVDGWYGLGVALRHQQQLGITDSRTVFRSWSTSRDVPG
jgi:hypothetical protein